MPHKILKLSSVPLKPRKARRDMHFANFIPSGLPRFWTHYTVNIRHFAKEYSLPLILSAVFLLLVIGASFLRVYQRSSLADLLAGVTTIGQDYSTLLSKDKTDTINKNNDNELGAARTPAGSQASFALNPTGGTTPNPGTTPAPGGGNGGGTTPTPFSSSIASFQQLSAELECSGNINKPNCGKRYTFTATVSTQNGPGNVTYGWRSNFTSANEDNGFSATSGTGLKTLQKEILVPCLNPGNYSLRLDIFTPTATQSNTLSINHNCVGI